MSIELLDIQGKQEMSFSVLGPKPANTLFIYTGTAVFSFVGKGKKWVQDVLSFDIGASLTPAQYIKAVGTGSLNAVFNPGKAVNAGWAVDRVQVARSSITGKTRLSFDLAVADAGTIWRASYLVHVLANV